jgi:saccharopine dehydrogenase (NAD+, L-lysine-forming)
LLLHCAFWNPKAPKLFSFEEMADPKFRIKVIGDITCDIDGSIPSTTAATTIENPYFDYNAQNHQWLTEMHENTITTMAVDNLPCSLPRDASENFGQELMEKVLPLLIIDPENDLIQRASITKAGKLTQRYQYLQDFVA